MSDTVYVFGAGINRGIKDWHGLNPPLATDFFQQVFHSDKYFSQHYLERIKELTAFIESYWHLTIEDLKTTPFDLEACFTLIQLQLVDAQNKDERDKLLARSRVQYQLTALLAEFLSEFEVFAHSASTFMTLGQLLYEENPSIVTFNYDTLLEYAIESASGVTTNVPESFKGAPHTGKDIEEDELTYSHMKRNRPLSYGVKFDIIQLHRAGIGTYVEKEEFYKPTANSLYSPPILKLHGSLNWFTFSGVPRYPPHPDYQFVSLAGKTVICRGTWWNNEPPVLNNEILIPLLLTPALYKDIHQDRIILSIWDQARESLRQCKRLIVGGYSFPPTDFHTKRLFLEAFKDNSPHEITVINPDTSVIRTIKELCHFTKPVLACKNLEEYIGSYRK